jgi:hypothetical protein
MKKKKQPKPKDNGTSIVKAKRGKAAVSSEEPADEVWERLMKIREELGKGWQSEKSAVEILSEMRR